MTFARALAVCAVLALAGPARADSPKLADARLAIDDVRYDEAQRLLVAALQDGGNSPHALAEIYQLSARTAVALHHSELAEQYYRRWIALEPEAALSDDVAPKLRERFVAAQAYMAAHGRLSVIAKRNSDGTIAVIVESDPLVMVASVALGSSATVPLGVDHPAQLAASTGTIDVLDEHGNHLLAVAVPPPAAATPAPAVVAPAPAPAHHRSVFAQPLAWAVPAVAFAGAAVGFGLAARSADNDLTAIVAQSRDHFYDDATSVRDRRDRDALVTNIAIGVAGACAVTAIVLAIAEHGDDGHVARVVLAPTGMLVRW